MEDFIFHEGIVPSRYSFSFTESLFNQEAHRQLQFKGNWHSFFIFNQIKSSVEGSIHFHIQDGVAQSPFRATHGGFDLADNLQPEILLRFVDYIEQQLKQNGVTRIFIKLPLRVMSENEFNLVEDVLHTSGFKVLKREEGGILKVSQSFDDRIHYSKRKRLKKVIRNNFQWDKVDSSELKRIYSFLLQCRSEKGYDLSMSLAEMHDLITQFPSSILLFAVMKDDQLIAASICIRISHSVLYDFYHDHDASYNDFSPIVFLVKSIHDYCYINQISLLDLGTAMIEDKVNTGLLEFKLKLGANRAIKYSFEKSYL